MTPYIISFDSDRLGYGKVILENPDKSGIPSGVTAVVGENGSGKTTLGTILEKGRYAYGNRLGFSPEIKRVKMLTFTDIHALTGIDVQYYNQRMEATMNEYVPVTGDILGKKANSPEWDSLTKIFRLEDVLEKKINYLSSGELRKLLIINALLDSPDLLILDNAYIGLDATSRMELDEAMKNMRGRGYSIILLLCDYGDVPDFTDNIITMSGKRISLPVDAKSNLRQLIAEDNTKMESRTVPPLPEKRLPQKPDCETVFSIRNGHARYGEKVIFENFNWDIRKGECWALMGRNGSGKSLLLSMVCADNPQGYANEITLFDRKRGTGESIWEIKDAVGYVCPEMQLYFRSNDPVSEIIIQGLRNSLNKYRPSSDEEKKIATEWMTLLDINHLADRHFSELSSGEQRLVLVARAMIKQPDLLVLDEPLHGLDRNHKERIRKIISGMMKRNGTSLIFVTHYVSEIPECVTHEKRIGN